MLAHNHVQPHRHDGLQVLQRSMHNLSQETEFLCIIKHPEQNVWHKLHWNNIHETLVYKKSVRNSPICVTKTSTKKIQSSNILESEYFWDKSSQEMSVLWSFRAG